MKVKALLFKLVVIILIPVAAVAATAQGAQALMLQLSLEELSDKADSIVMGTVESATAVWNEDRTAINTTVVVSVEEDYKNDRQQNTVSIVVPGGEVDGITQAVSDTPVFEPGERAVLFLNEKSRPILPRGEIQPKIYELCGQFQGKLEVEGDKVRGTPLNIFGEGIRFHTGNASAEPDDRMDLASGSNWWDMPDGSDGGEDSVDDDRFVYLGFHWSGSSPEVPYYINAQSDRAEQIRIAADKWSNAGANFAFRYGGTHSRTGTASFNGKNEIMGYNLQSNYVLAVATIWFEGDTILETDMVFNTRFQWSTTGSDGHDVQTVALHEFGHWLGLDHCDVVGSVLYPTIWGVNRTLHAVDISGIRYIYGTADSDDPEEPAEPEDPVPANNYFADRVMIGDLAGYTTGSNVNASAEAGEPDHAGVAGGQSVWWEWVAPASGMMEIDTFESNFDTLLAVYTGSAVSGLTEIAANDDYGGAGQSRVEFEAAGGTAYKIAVDGRGSAAGSIALNWELTPFDPVEPEPEQYLLTVQTEGRGSTSPAAGTHSFEDGTAVTLEAVPAGGWRFARWLINAAESGNRIETIYMTGNITATAVFEEKPATEPAPDSGPVTGSDPNPPPAEAAPEPVKHSLTISILGEGSTTPGPGTHLYAEGETADILAAPEPGWAFLKWDIDGLEYMELSRAIKMDGDRDVQAHFTRLVPGDMTGNGKVTVSDIAIIVRHTLGLAAMTGDQIAAADVNGDGAVDVRDITLLMRYTLGLISSLPAH